MEALILDAIFNILKQKDNRDEILDGAYIAKVTAGCRRYQNNLTKVVHQNSGSDSDELETGSIDTPRLLMERTDSDVIEY